MNMTVKKASIPHMTNRIYRGAKIMRNLAFAPASVSLGVAAMEASAHSLNGTVGFAALGFAFLKIMELSINAVRQTKYEFMRIKCRAMRLQLTKFETLSKKMFPDKTPPDYSEQKAHLTDLYNKLDEFV